MKSHLERNWFLSRCSEYVIWPKRWSLVLFKGGGVRIVQPQPQACLCSELKTGLDFLPRSRAEIAVYLQ